MGLFKNTLIATPEPNGDPKKNSRAILKPIQDIRPGDWLVSYDSFVPGFNGIYGGRGGVVVEAVNACRNDGPVYTIQAGDFTTRAVVEQRWLAKFAQSEGFVVYLMCRKDRFRVGVTELFRNKEKNLRSLGLGIRASTQGADAAYILTVVNSRDDAEDIEAYINTIYGIPDQQFFASKGRYGDHLPERQARLDRWWDGFIEAMPDHHEKVLQCLQSFDRRIDQPFWVPKGPVKVKDATKAFVVNTCNLIPGVMSLKTFDSKTNNGEWCRLSTSLVSTKDESYALQVSPLPHAGEAKNYNPQIRRLFIADGLVAHGLIDLNIKYVPPPRPLKSDLRPEILKFYRLPERPSMKEIGDALGMSAAYVMHQIKAHERETGEQLIRNRPRPTRTAPLTL